MNRKNLQALITFALHMHSRLDWTNNQVDVARDTLELSRLAKRLHRLDERFANGTIQANDEGTGEYDKKAKNLLYAARVIMGHYGYVPYRQYDPRSASLYAALPGLQRKIVVPY